MSQTDSYVYVLLSYLALYSLVYLVYQKFKQRNTDSDQAESG